MCAKLTVYVDLSLMEIKVISRIFRLSFSTKFAKNAEARRGGVFARDILNISYVVKNLTFFTS